MKLMVLMDMNHMLFDFVFPISIALIHLCLLVIELIHETIIFIRLISINENKIVSVQFTIITI